MQDRESATSRAEDGPESAEAARARLASALRGGGRAISPAIQEAFAHVPRHIFVPEVGAAAAYRDEAFVIKCGPDGLPVSSSSQPAMMAIMLDQLGLEPGHRVLEIGSGSGYNAAVMAEVVGSKGHVVSVDIDADLVARAGAGLAAAGYHEVVVSRADGGFGDPGRAPFDRIIVTAGAWDIAPAWLEQLVPAGRLVLPLSIRGIQLSIAFERHGCAWIGSSACRCGFVRMLGAFAGPERVLRLDGPRPLFAQVSDGRPADAAGLLAALAGPTTDVTPPVSTAGPVDFADLDLWLTVTQLDLDRITVLPAVGGWLPVTEFLPLGGLVSDAADAGRLAIAVVLPGGGATDEAGANNDVVVRGYGSRGAELAERLAELVRDWLDLGRPGAADLHVRVVQRKHETRLPEAGVPRDGMITIARPSVLIELGWPSVS